MTALALERRPCRECRFDRDGPAARFCTRCGAPRRAAGPDAVGWPPPGSEARIAWRSYAPAAGDFGPARIALGRHEHPVMWLSDGQWPYVLTTSDSGFRLDQLDLRPGRTGRSPVLTDLPTAGLHALTVSPVGAFFVSDGTLRALVAVAQDVEPVAAPLLPAGARTVGLAVNGERLFALALHNDHVEVYGGSAAGPLRRMAAVRAALPAESWCELAVDPAIGRAAFWGAGVLGTVDLAQGHIAIREDGRAPSLPLPLRERLGTGHGRFAASDRGAAPVPADVEAGWGLLCAVSGRFTPAPRDLTEAFAVAGLGESRAVALTSEGALVLVEGDGGALAIKRGWNERATDQAAVAVRGDRVLAVVGSPGQPLRALWFGVQADGVPALADETVLAQGAAPLVDANFPPLSLPEEYAVAALLESDLLIWRTPRARRR
jgi:hypothetical protein